MYAIIEDGGKQYKVEKGTILNIETRPIKDGQTEIQLDRILLCRDEQSVVVGRPYVEGVKITAAIKGQTAGPKLHPAKFRRRKNSKSRTGHRQKYVEVVITDIVK